MKPFALFVTVCLILWPVWFFEVSRALSISSSFLSFSSVFRPNVILFEGASSQDNGFLGKFFFARFR